MMMMSSMLRLISRGRMLGGLGGMGNIWGAELLLIVLGGMGL